MNSIFFLLTKVSCMRDDRPTYQIWHAGHFYALCQVEPQILLDRAIEIQSRVLYANSLQAHSNHGSVGLLSFT